MSHHPNQTGGTVTVLPADLESALGLINLIGAAGGNAPARAGRDWDCPSSAPSVTHTAVR